MPIRFLFLSALVLAGAVHAQDTSFTYQGQLQSGGALFSGIANLEFTLYDSPSGGTIVAGPLVRNDWPVSDGLFQVELDFGAAFDGSQRWLEINVDGTVLAPRQAVTPTPVAMFALSGNEGPQGPPGPEGASPFELVDDNAVYMQGNVGIGTLAPLAPLQIQFNSGIGSPQIRLVEEGNDFARFSFENDQGTGRFWTLAGVNRAEGVAGDEFNIFNNGTGNILSLRGDGRVGINTTNPQAPMSVRSQSNWNPNVGNGRGDFYIGDGEVGLSIGVALGGGGQGASRIWTKGGV